MLTTDTNGKLIIITAILATLISIISPWTQLDILALFIAIIIIGQILFKEKMLLFFLVVRPALDYWREAGFFQYKNYLLNFNGAFALLFFAWALWTVFPYLKKIKKTWLLLASALLPLIMIISALYSVSFFTSLIESIKFLNLIFLFWLSYTLIKENIINKKTLIISIAIGAIIPVLTAGWQLISGSGMTTFGLHGRIYGTFAHPNVLAFYLLFLIFILIQHWLSPAGEFWKKHQFILYSFFFILLALLTMTYTRASWVGLLIFILIITFVKYKKIFLTIIGILALAYLIFYPFNNWLKHHTDYNLQSNQIVSRLTSRNEDADSLSWRLSLLQETTPLIHVRPLLGYGYGTFEQVWSANRGISHFWDDSAEAHNDYLKIILEIGLIGLVAYLFFLGALYWQTLKLFKKNNEQYIYLLAWLSAFAIMSLSDNMLHHTPVMFLMWSWWGAMLAETIEK